MSQVISIGFVRQLLRVLGFAGIAASMLTPAVAGCVSDCRDEFESQLESCRSQYDEPDDADDLEQCIHNAREEYQDCIQECRS